MNRTSEIEKTIHEILDECFWPQSLDCNQVYFRTHDDCDGNLVDGLSVTITPDGDAFVKAVAERLYSCRFRMPLSGGGLSPRVRNALLILAMAIKKDNEEFPING